MNRILLWVPINPIFYLLKGTITTHKALSQGNQVEARVCWVDEDVLVLSEGSGLRGL